MVYSSLDLSDSQFAGLLRVAVASDSIPMGEGRPPVQVQPGDIIWSSYRNAHLNVRDDFGVAVACTHDVTNVASRFP